MPGRLTTDDLNRAAQQLGCSLAALAAVDVVESRGEGFLPSGEPKILYEPHKFDAHTEGRFRGRAVVIEGVRYEISYRSWRKGAYGPERVQHAKLQEACRLDRDAALMSCSWGRYQVLGEHWGKLGYASLQAFVNAMYQGEDGHLDAFVRYVTRVAPRCAPAIRALDWRTFARYYNGTGQVADYARRLESAYRRFLA